MTPNTAGPPEPDPLAALAYAVRQDHPMELLIAASTLTSTITQQTLLSHVAGPGRGSGSAFAPDGQAEGLGGVGAADEADIDDDLPSVQEFGRGLLEVGSVEAVALARVIAEMAEDRFLAKRAAAALKPLANQGSRWLGDVARTVPVRAVSLMSVLQHEETIFLEVTTGGVPYTLAVAVDRTGAPFLEDAYPIDLSITDALAPVPGIGTDMEVSDLTLADARARIVEAMDMGDHIVPQPESESWPSMRPLLRWALRFLPAGGRGFDLHDWTSEEIRQLATDFLSSPAAEGFDEDMVFDVELLLRFQADYGSNQPLRWGSDFTEALLLDLIPRKVIAPPEELLRVPDLMRSFIPWANERSGMPSEFTRNALEVIDEVEDDFRQLVLDDDDDPFRSDMDDFRSLLDPSRLMLDLAMWDMWRLEEEVGSEEALKDLDESPLPAESFQDDGVPEDIAPRVRELAAQVEELAGAVFDDPEMTTSAHRVLAAAAKGSPQVFRRRFTDLPTVASICWITGRINRWFNPGVPERTVQHLMQTAGVRSSPGQRAAVLRAAIRPAQAIEAAHPEDRVWDPAADWLLGDPGLLTSTARRLIGEERDRLTIRIEDITGEYDDM